MSERVDMSTTKNEPSVYDLAKLTVFDAELKDTSEGLEASSCG